MLVENTNPILYEADYQKFNHYSPFEIEDVVTEIFKRLYNIEIGHQLIPTEPIEIIFPHTLVWTIYKQLCFDAKWVSVGGKLISHEGSDFDIPDKDTFAYNVQTCTVSDEILDKFKTVNRDYLVCDIIITNARCNSGEYYACFDRMIIKESLPVKIYYAGENYIPYYHLSDFHSDVYTAENVLRKYPILTKHGKQDFKLVCVNDLFNAGDESYGIITVEGFKNDVPRLLLEINGSVCGDVYACSKHCYPDYENIFVRITNRVTIYRVD